MNKKDKIAESTFILSLKYGFDNISIKQIQEESGITTGSIYYYFKDKDDILLYIVEYYLANWIKQYKEKIRNINGTFIEKITFTFNAILFKEDFDDILGKIGADYREYYLLFSSVYHQHPEVRQIYDEFNLDLYILYKELIQESIEKKEIRSDINIEKIVLFILTSLKGYVDVWFIPNFSFEKIVEANVELIWEAVKKR
jgi:AcrR family transcriptional regulator